VYFDDLVHVHDTDAVVFLTQLEGDQLREYVLFCHECSLLEIITNAGDFVKMEKEKQAHPTSNYRGAKALLDIYELRSIDS
jgi:hypothetical protein